MRDADCRRLRENYVVILWRIFSLTAVTVGLFLCRPSTPLAAQNSEPSPIQDAEEYAVYSAVLNAEFAAETATRQFVIDDYTPSPKKPKFTGFIGGLTFSGAALPPIDPQTAADFDAKIKESSALERKFSLNLPYVLVSECDLRKIFPPDAQGHIDAGPWQQFYEKYPGALGIISLSRVGFNSTKQEAVVRVAVQYGLLGGSGKVFVLSKRSEKWEIRKKVTIWLS